MAERPFFQNERDIEIPLLIDFVSRHTGYTSNLLDVGVNHATYLPELRKRIGVLHGIDLTVPHPIMPLLDKFFQGDINIIELPRYDLVISISTVEHIGVEYYQTANYRELQIEAVRKMALLAKRAAFVTMPYGEPILNCGHYYQWNARVLEETRREIRPLKMKTTFWSTPDRIKQGSWREVPQTLADKATNELSGGVNTICVIEIEGRG